MTLAVLTVIRDLGLPAPAGAVLISPWCDLTHSFRVSCKHRDRYHTAVQLHSQAIDVVAHPRYKPLGEEGNKTAHKEADGSDEPRRKVPATIHDDKTTSEKRQDGTEPIARKGQHGGSLANDQEEAHNAARKKGESDASSSTPNGFPRAPTFSGPNPSTSPWRSFQRRYRAS